MARWLVPRLRYMCPAVVCLVEGVVLLAVLAWFCGGPHMHTLQWAQLLAALPPLSDAGAITALCGQMPPLR